MAAVRTWERRDIPDFSPLSCYILPGANYAMCVAMFAKAGFSKAESPEKADLVVFIGGADVNPKLYEHKNVRSGMPDDNRDAYEKKVYDMCLRRGIPMVGICRGAQILHVFNDGVLWQHVDGHGGVEHYIVDQDTGERVLANSTHHQMLQDNEFISVLAVTENQVSKHFHGANAIVTLQGDEAHEIEIEAAKYSNTLTLMVQGHPEHSKPEFTSWFFHKLKDFLADDACIYLKGDA